MNVGHRMSVLHSFFIKNRRRSAVSIVNFKHISHIFHNFENVIASWDRGMHLRLCQTSITELFATSLLTH